MSVNFDDILNFTYKISIPRQVGSQGHETVKQMIIRKLGSVGLNVSLNNFSRTIGSERINFTNIFARRPNQKTFSVNKKILLCAHYDGHKSGACAMDSAVCIAVICEFARVLPNTVDFDIVFFDGEEAIGGPWDSQKNLNNLSGSLYWAYTHSPDDYSAVYLFSLWNGNIGKQKIKNNEYATESDLAAKYYQRLQRNNKLLYFDEPVFSSQVINTRVQDDSYPFKKRGYTVVELIPLPFYASHHTELDTPDSLNWDFIKVLTGVTYKTILDFHS